MRPWQAVIFDLDDTLYPEIDFVLSGMRAVARWTAIQFAMSERTTFQELAESVRLGVDGYTFDHWLKVHDLPRGSIASMVDVYRQHEPTISPYPGTYELLESLRAKSRLGIVTDGYWAVQQRKVAALGLGPYFEDIVYSDQWGRDYWKPSPRPFQHILHRLGVDPIAAIYVGDNPAKDFHGARLAGMWTTRIRHAGGIHHDAEPAMERDAPTWDVSTFDELNHILSERVTQAGLR